MGDYNYYYFGDYIEHNAQVSGYFTGILLSESLCSKSLPLSYIQRLKKRWGFFIAE